MDADGMCLVVSPCNQCKINKNGVQACLNRRHNPRLTAVRKENLASRHRQCVKPDQAMTIFKLVDRESGEENVEFSPGMVFQRSCSSCTHLKTCILGGHTLTDWVPEDGRALTQQAKRKSVSSDASIPPTSHEQQPFNKARRVSEGSKTSITIPGPALKAAAAIAAATAGPRVTGTPKDGGAAVVKKEGRPRRRISKGRRTLTPEGAVAAAPVAAAAESNGMNGDTDLAVPSTKAHGGGVVGDTRGKGARAAPPQSITSQLDALAAEEDSLLQQYQIDTKRLDEAKASREKEILAAQEALEDIKATREAKKSMVAEQRRKLVAERDRLTHLRCQEVIREEAEHRLKKNVLWSAIEPDAVEEVAGGNILTTGNDSNAIASQLALAVDARFGVVTQTSSDVMVSREAEPGTALSLPLPSALPQPSGSSPLSCSPAKRATSGNGRFDARVGRTGSRGDSARDVSEGNEAAISDSLRSLRGAEGRSNEMHCSKANGLVRGDDLADSSSPSRIGDEYGDGGLVAKERADVNGRGKEDEERGRCQANANLDGCDGSNGAHLTAAQGGAVAEEDEERAVSVGVTPTKSTAAAQVGVEASESCAAREAVPVGPSAGQPAGVRRKLRSDSAMEVDEVPEDEGKREGKDGDSGREVVVEEVEEEEVVEEGEVEEEVEKEEVVEGEEEEVVEDEDEEDEEESEEEEVVDEEEEDEEGEEEDEEEMEEEGGREKGVVREEEYRAKGQNVGEQQENWRQEGYEVEGGEKGPQGDVVGDNGEQEEQEQEEEGVGETKENKVGDDEDDEDEDDDDDDDDDDDEDCGEGISNEVSLSSGTKGKVARSGEVATTKLDLQEAAVKTINTGYSNRAKQQGVRKGPRHGGMLVE